VYWDGSTVVILSGVMFMGIVGVTDAGDEAMLLLDGGIAADNGGVDIAAVASGVARRAAHPSFPRN